MMCSRLIDYGFFTKDIGERINNSQFVYIQMTELPAKQVQYFNIDVDSDEKRKFMILSTFPLPSSLERDLILRFIGLHYPDREIAFQLNHTAGSCLVGADRASKELAAAVATVAFTAAWDDSEIIVVQVGDYRFHLNLTWNGNCLEISFRTDEAHS
jgi:hypothetical protein